MHILRDVEVEARIIYEDNHIRLPRFDVLLAEAHIPQDGAQMKQYRQEAHIGQLTIMLHAGASHSSHHVATKEAKLCRSILLLQLLHQVRGMQVTTGLTSYQVVFHCALNVVFSKSLSWSNAS